MYATNLAILGMALALSLVFGFTAYLLIQLVILMVAGGAGVWMFYVQHQFEDVYWERGEDWSLRCRRLAGKFFLQAAPHSAMVLWQHRFSPHPSPESRASPTTTWKSATKLIRSFNK